MPTKTVAAGGVGESITLHYREDDWPIIEPLLPHLQYGPSYKRAVLGNLTDYSNFIRKGEEESALIYLDRASQHGGGTPGLVIGRLW